MFCLACGGVAAAPLCRLCRGSVRRGPEWVTGHGLRIAAAASHGGPVRRLVHRLKYEAMPGVAGVLAGWMAPLVPPEATALVPVPRAVLRRWRHGVDPALELSRELGRLTGLPVIEAVKPALWWAHHAGRGAGLRHPARFSVRCPAAASWVLVDDVATTGSTMVAAFATLGGVPDLGLVATAPSRVTREGGPRIGDPAARRLRGGSVHDPDGSAD